MLLMDWEKTNGLGNYSHDGFDVHLVPYQREDMIEIIAFIRFLPTEIMLDKFTDYSYRDIVICLMPSLEQQTDTEELWSGDIFCVELSF